jgi:diketogulonate reductase-like aldo/keto reductase
MPLMAYSPVDHGRLLQHRAVRDLAGEKGVTPAQLAIVWVLRSPDVFAVVKASTRARVVENRAALEIGFSQAELDQLDRLFPRRPARSRSTSSRTGPRAGGEPCKGSRSVCISWCPRGDLNPHAR